MLRLRLRMALRPVLSMVLVLAGCSSSGRRAEPAVVLQLTDLHIANSSGSTQVTQAVAWANAAIRPDLTLITGDIADKGKEKEYDGYKKSLAKLHGPVYTIPGNHDHPTPDAAAYKQALGKTTYAFDAGRYHFVAMDSTVLDGEQVQWARQDLQAAHARGQVNLLVIHHPFDALKDPSALTALADQGHVKFVIAGHTHNNRISNSGQWVMVTTTSLTKPGRQTGAAGYGLLTFDEGRIAWHGVPANQRPVVAIANPISQLMVTGPEGLVRGTIQIRAHAMDQAPIRVATATIDGRTVVVLRQQPDGLWTVPWNSAALADGEHKLKVEATTADGRTSSEEITIIIRQGGSYEPVKLAWPE